MSRSPKRENHEPKTFIGYVPHGINPNSFYRMETDEDIKKVNDMRSRMFNGKEVDFAVIFNNRNIRRKMPADVVLAFKMFNDMLTPERAERTRLIMHTNPRDENGTDLLAVVAELAPKIKVVFSTDRVDTPILNTIYNCADVCINLASNEGFGLTTMEALMAERMIVATVTGGLQDQMGFTDDGGNLLHEDVHYNSEWYSNHDQKYTDYGEWVVPVFPSNVSLIGSLPTPYIYDDRALAEDAAHALYQIYQMDPEERIRRGKLGREYALNHGFNAEEMGRRMAHGIEHIIDNFTPRKRFSIYKAGM